VRKLNPGCAFFEVSAKTGEGFDPWADWLRTNVREWNQEE
jgi:hydrogenase nickel incorporation protein HypB